MGGSHETHDQTESQLKAATWRTRAASCMATTTTTERTPILIDFLSPSLLPRFPLRLLSLSSLSTSIEIFDES